MIFLQIRVANYLYKIKICSPREIYFTYRKYAWMLPPRLHYIDSYIIMDTLVKHKIFERARGGVFVCALP